MFWSCCPDATNKLTGSDAKPYSAFRNRQEGKQECRTEFCKHYWLPTVVLVSTSIKDWELCQNLSEDLKVVSPTSFMRVDLHLWCLILAYFITYQKYLFDTETLYPKSSEVSLLTNLELLQVWALMTQCIFLLSYSLIDIRINS